jgi:hypothetical protein
MAGARGLCAACCTAESRDLEQSWPWQRVSQSAAGMSWACVARRYALVAGDCAVAFGASRGPDTRRGLIMPITRVAVFQDRPSTPAVQIAFDQVETAKIITVYK